MTKQEFIQEAALRCISKDVSYITVASYARSLADEIYGDDEEPQPEEEDFRSAPVLKVAEEMNRLDELRTKERIEKYGCTSRKSGLHYSFLKACDYSEIKTVGNLLDCGSIGFSKSYNVGNVCVKLIGEALKNLYGIKAW